jgi:uncharacterized repeat protein (TIGR03803 family)
MSYKRFLGAASAALLIVIVILMLAPGAWAGGKFKTLHRFKTKDPAGTGPQTLIFDQAGNLYGTTWCGGCGGAVFELTPNPDGTWTENVLYRFDYHGGSGGSQAMGGLIFDAAGNLYGATTNGGANFSGVVYKLAPNPNGSWTESALYSFCSLTNCADGAAPSGGLIFDQAGNLYGTTTSGGANGVGVVYKLTPNPDGTWTESVLYGFKGGKEGRNPQSELTFDAAGNLYGITLEGGDLTCFEGLGCGTVFELAPNADGSWKHKLLHRFTGKDGSSPSGPLIFDAAGNLYGIAFEGGGSSCFDGEGCGTVFRLSPNANGGWTAKVLHRFTGGKDGATPEGGLTLDVAGNLYGTTTIGGNLNPNCAPFGGSIGCGVVFKLTLNANGVWKEKVLHRFTDRGDGSGPGGNLIFDTAGNLYGTTQGGSDKDNSTVFEITP